MDKQTITKEIKTEKLVFRASTEFVEKLDQYIKEKKLNKSDFIRTAITNEMQRRESGARNAMLNDNAFYNYVLAESVASPKCKELIKKFMEVHKIENEK